MSGSRTSRNNYTVVMRIVNNAGYLVEREHLDIRPTLMRIVYSDNQQFTPLSNDNWSRIAWRKLGDGRFWWLIADFSQIVDPFTDFQSQTRHSYLTQLGADVPAGSVSSMTVKDSNVIVMGMTLFVENLDPSNPVNFTCTVQQVNETNVLFTPTSSPGIPHALSRVSQVVVVKPTLTCPSTHTAFFESLNFSNPLNVLVP